MKNNEQKPSERIEEIYLNDTSPTYIQLDSESVLVRSVIKYLDEQAEQHAKTAKVVECDVASSRLGECQCNSKNPPIASELARFAEAFLTIEQGLTNEYWDLECNPDRRLIIMAKQALLKYKESL